MKQNDSRILSVPSVTVASLRDHLVDARDRLHALTRDFAGPRLLGPMLDIVNPPLWEIGHVGWFQERWCLRLREDGTLADSMLPGADALYDSSAVAHDTRWGLPLPDEMRTRGYLAAVLERVLERLEREPGNERLAYFAQLAAYHEDMHNEAFHYTRQSMGDADPFPGGAAPVSGTSMPEGDVAFEGGDFLLGALPDRGGFVFDNEKWAHPVRIRPFRMARAPVTNAQYLAWVEAGGFQPRHWRRRDGVWMQQRFDQLEPLNPEEPVLHVNWHQADAFCAWAGRRLPTEAEWEYAASRAKATHPWGDAPPSPERACLESSRPVPVGACAEGDTAEGLRQMVGNVWEWTASDFLPYRGFAVDPYKEYSEPWFGTRKVLRGGSFATPARLLRNTWRNFFTPDRSDVFCGFRTCALD
jgi:iron(II)-dependent oxidoreductase